jgi:tRNA(Ile2) C34 agmatinyltransferase TiaS
MSNTAQLEATRFEYLEEVAGLNGHALANEMHEVLLHAEGLLSYDSQAQGRVKAAIAALTAPVEGVDPECVTCGFKASSRGGCTDCKEDMFATEDEDESDD